MTVRTRLLASFAAVTALLLLPGLFAAARLAELRDLAVEGRSRHAAAALLVGRLRASLAELDRYERSYVATGMADLRASAERETALMRQDLDSLRASPYAGPAASMDPVIDRIAAVAATVHALMQADSVQDATEAFGLLEPLFSESDRRLRALADSIDRIAQEDFQRAEAISAASRRSTLVGVASVLVVAGLLAVWTTRALTRPLGRLAEATAAVAGGRLGDPADLPYDRRDEIGTLSTSFRSMTRRLAELDRMKAEFVEVASHELKTPINVISGYTELIEEELEADLTEHQTQILHGILEQTRVMSRLVSWLMDISRVEAGTYRVEFETVHVADLVTGLLRAFDVLARGKGVTLEADVTPSAPETLVIDIDIMRDEVLGNLVSNALAHTPEGGRITVEVTGTEGHVVIEVADTGTGIPSEHRRFIFDKYYQAGPSVGAGLGLAIAREMVEAHGGTIALAPPVEGRGAVFRVTLPRTNVPGGTAWPPVAPALGNGNSGQDTP